MKAYKIIIVSTVTPLIFLMAIISSCTKKSDPYVFPDPDTLSKGLKGTWIESTKRTDTIIFTSNTDTGYFTLNRGKILVNDHSIPDYGSGIYFYRITGDTIKTIWALSSASEPYSYYFSLIDTACTIRVGKFAPFSVSDNPLTFRKIR